MTETGQPPRRVVLYGSRPDGHAKASLDLLDANTPFVVAGLVDDYPLHRERRVRGLAVIGTGDDLKRLRAEGIQGALLGFGDAPGRLDAVERALRAGLQLPIFLHRSAHVSPSALVGDGAQVLGRLRRSRRQGRHGGPDQHSRRGRARRRARRGCGRGAVCCHSGPRATRARSDRRCGSDRSTGLRDR